MYQLNNTNSDSDLSCASKKQIKQQVFFYTAHLSHQRPLQVEGLSILEEQHDVSLQVTQTAVAMTSNPLLTLTSERITHQASLLTFKHVFFFMCSAAGMKTCYK